MNVSCFICLTPEIPDHAPGHTLIELLTALTIGILLLATALPRFSSSSDEASFQAFASELTGHLVMARRQAQIHQISVALDFSGADEWNYACFFQNQGEWELQGLSPHRDGYRGKILNQLPPFAISHPTQNKTLDAALKSTHKPRVIFAPEGSSNATLVFSDGGDRVVCAVISGQTGRFRVFIKTPRYSDWKIFF